MRRVAAPPLHAAIRWLGLQPGPSLYMRPAVHPVSLLAPPAIFFGWVGSRTIRGRIGRWPGAGAYISYIVAGSRKSLFANSLSTNSILLVLGAGDLSESRVSGKESQFAAARWCPGARLATRCPLPGVAQRWASTAPWNGMVPQTGRALVCSAGCTGDRANLFLDAKRTKQF